MNTACENCSLKLGWCDLIHDHVCIINMYIFLQDMGTVVMGKVESGGVMKGTSLLLMPNRVSVTVKQIPLEATSIDVNVPLIVHIQIIVH